MDDAWKEFIQKESLKKYFIDLQIFLEKEYATENVYPKREQIYSAFQLTPLSKVKVVILGQDPYHGHNQAHGLAFSVKPGVKKPPSLRNIYKEIENDLHISMSESGTLTKWAEQGVFLLNTVLTVRESEPGSHNGKGWEIFTDNVITSLNDSEQPIVFMLWGKQAQGKEKYITNPDHLVLKAAHPSPLSAHRGFFGCRHFSKANHFLRSHNIDTIDWQI